jgi:hypothetical protein
MLKFGNSCPASPRPVLAFSEISRSDFVGREGTQASSSNLGLLPTKKVLAELPLVWSGRSRIFEPLSPPGALTSSTLSAAISPTRIPARPLTIVQQRLRAGSAERLQCWSARYMTALLKPGLVSLLPPLARKKLETSMFSDGLKSNRRDC